MPTTKGFVRPGQAYISSTNVKEVLGDTVPYIENNLLNQTIINLLKIRQQVTVEDLISILKQYSLSGEGSSDFAERVYRSLASRDISATMLGDLKQNNIIFIPTNPETKWVSRNSVIWRDRSDILGDDFIYLEKYYPKLKDFFIDKVQIKEDIDTETFANQWLKLQDTPIIDVKEIETALTVIYQEIQAILPFDNDPPNWWQDFKNKAKIWTQNKIFMQSDKVFVPDAPELKQIFKGPSVNFAWRPEKDSFSKWEELYRAFDLPYLSESVNISLSETDKYENNPSPLFLTTPSKILIATWIKEVRSLDYQRLLESKTLDAFFETTEACVSSLTLIYRLDNKDVTRTSDVFWNKKEYVLLVSKSQNGKAKNAIAGVLARDLMPNRAYKELMDWIELVLGEVDETWRLQQKNWRIPDELKKWLENDDRDLSSEPDYSSKDRISSENLPDEYIQENSEEEPFDYLAELEKSLNKNGATQIKNEQEPIDRSVHNAERRREKEFIAQKERISSEPYSEDRRRKTERTILEGPDKMVRETLQEWYGGKCQICGNTFPERDGQPFFVANYLVQRKLARQVDSYANALCLCADHFAKWQHGTIEAEEIIDQINSLKLVSEGGDGNLRLKIRLCGEECFITFNEKHVIAFQELQNVYKQVDVSDTEG